ncbi:MAG TPA: hypothetical protein VD970_17720, partial [Acetobacteraceae bacterium]|nr:hypothetical protein [Acetobacteraceae bacterium]
GCIAAAQWPARAGDCLRPGAASRQIACRIGGGHVLGIGRSARAIALARAASRAELASGCLSVRHVAVEDVSLLAGDERYEIALAVRVGAFDGRDSEAGRQARRRLAAALRPSGRLFTDGGNPLREVRLTECETGPRRPAR